MYFHFPHCINISLMLRAPPPHDLRYCVCVVEAAAPCECPAKVRLSVRRQAPRCLAWGSGYRKVTTFRFPGESDLETSDLACPLRLPESTWHTSHGLDLASYPSHSRSPVLTFSHEQCPTTSASCPDSSGVSYSASTSNNHDPIHSIRSTCGYGPATSQCHGAITCTSKVACLNLEPLLRAHGNAGERSEMHVSITRRGGWKSSMYVPLEGFLEQLGRGETTRKKFILRVRWEDEVIDVEAAPSSPPSEMEGLQEALCGREVNVMPREAEAWSDWEEDEERQDQEFCVGENESDGEMDAGIQEAFDREIEACDASQGTGNEETIIGETENAEHTQEKVEIDEITNRELENNTEAEREQEGNTIRTQDQIAMRQLNTDHIKEEYKIDITMKIRLNDPEQTKHRTGATPNEVSRGKERTCQYHEPSPGEMTPSTSFSLCVYCLLLPLFVASLILLLYMWVRDVPL